MIWGFLTSDIAKGWYMAGARHGLVAGGALLIKYHVIACTAVEQCQQYNDYLGSGLCLAGLAWSAWQEYNHQSARSDKTTGK